MDAQSLADRASSKLGVEPVNVIEIREAPRSGYKNRLRGLEGMTFVLTNDQILKAKMIDDGWGHRGYAGGEVLFKEL